MHVGASSFVNKVGENLKRGGGGGGGAAGGLGLGDNLNGGGGSGSGSGPSVDAAKRQDLLLGVGRGASGHHSGTGMHHSSGSGKNKIENLTIAKQIECSIDRILVILHFFLPCGRLQFMALNMYAYLRTQIQETLKEREAVKK